ncbi:MAG: hypothetical protein RIS20_1232 [Bacteroidota bacterium]|jgi:uncharacterized NAD(P)/FAD-binding protein YdhS
MPKKIAVIGGGVSGTMVIRHLVDLGFNGTIDRFFRGESQTTGPAYQESSFSLLLNVRNKNMSAFPDDPAHFLRFLKENYPEHSLPNEFVPRSIYGTYLTQIWHETQRLAKEAHIQLNLFHESQPDYEQYDSIVLATGNELPRIPNGLSKPVRSSTLYQGNPWKIDFSHIDQELPIFILGNGLTMVDTVLSLRHAGFHQKIVALSTHGFNMLAHPENEELINAGEQPSNTDLASLIRFFNIHRKRRSNNQFLLFVDFFRPQFSSWWQGFTLKEKQTFLNRFRHIWGTIRHRIPGQIARIINEEQEKGRLNVCAGKLASVDLSSQGLTIHFFSGGQQVQNNFACLINCTGPETAITRMTNPVITNLYKNGWIYPDKINQGIDIDAETHTVQGKAPMKIFAIGNLCKGTKWESTAIGELRSQAKLIAKGILDA